MLNIPLGILLIVGAFVVVSLFMLAMGVFGLIKFMLIALLLYLAYKAYTQGRLNVSN